MLGSDRLDDGWVWGIAFRSHFPGLSGTPLGALPPHGVPSSRVPSRDASLSRVRLHRGQPPPLRARVPGPGSQRLGAPSPGACLTRESWSPPRFEERNWSSPAGPLPVMGCTELTWSSLPPPPAMGSPSQWLSVGSFVFVRLVRSLTLVTH